MSEKTAEQKIRDEIADANLATEAAGPWPREGEIWTPIAPWPERGCPAGMYVHKLGSLDGPIGWTWAIQGRADLAFKVHPVTIEAATAMAWEFRYGSATMRVFRLGTPGYDPNEPIPVKPAADAPGRYGPHAIVIVVAGANMVWARREGEQEMTTYAVSDLRRGFVRVSEPPPLAEVCL